jgi:hypothetical protein
VTDAALGRQVGAGALGQTWPEPLRAPNACGWSTLCAVKPRNGRHVCRRASGVRNPQPTTLQNGRHDCKRGKNTRPPTGRTRRPRPPHGRGARYGRHAPARRHKSTTLWEAALRGPGGRPTHTTWLSGSLPRYKAGKYSWRRCRATSSSARPRSPSPRWMQRRMACVNTAQRTRGGWGPQRTRSRAQAASDTSTSAARQRWRQRPARALV